MMIYIEGLELNLRNKNINTFNFIKQNTVIKKIIEKKIFDRTIVLFES